jgi:hypothetical protein
MFYLKGKPQRFGAISVQGSERFRIKRAEIILLAKRHD